MKRLEFVQSQVSGAKEASVKNTLELLNGGATVPFIARYRKEQTGGMDEVQIASVRDLAEKFDDLISRQQTIIESIEEQGRINDHLRAKIETCFNSTQLEDMYLPYKQKRLTRGEKARKKGLEPLAKMIMSQRGGNPDDMAGRFLKGDLHEPEEAINGAKDIIAEWVNENANLRERLRQQYERHATLESKLVKGKEQEGEKYRDYFEFKQSLSRCPSHRFLAIMRASKEGILSVKARPDEERAMEQTHRFFVKSNDESGRIVKSACNDAYRRLLRPSLENEVLTAKKLEADKEAVEVFAKNLRQLLLAPPVGSKRTLAIDPGFRTGCKVVCLDENGSLLTNATIYPHPPQKEMSKAKSKIAQMVQAYKIECIAVGDGTAGRETENMIKHIKFDRDVEVFVVREDGASIYSASSIAREEFPNYDVTVRGAVSIGRRLMDPLAELVKIDPKSIGVGQYQHDVHQQLLKTSLADTIVSCVNNVGVNINTASPYLLEHVSGLGASLAKGIVNYRDEIGGFESREELKKVPRLGDKAYEQCAGFIRIRNAKNPLDNSSVHPERYSLVEEMAKSLSLNVSDLIGADDKLNQLNKADFSQVDGFTFEDIIRELKKPGRDPRSTAKVLEFDHRVKTIDDLEVGMVLKGIVTNVTNFGAFVNIGIKENGLIHKSQLADTFIENPADFISLDEHVEVRVMEVDVQRKRIGLKRL